MGDVSQQLVVLLDLDQLTLVLDVEEEPHTVLKSNYDQLVFDAIHHTDSATLECMAPL